MVTTRHSDTPDTSLLCTCVMCHVSCVMCQPLLTFIYMTLGYRESTASLNIVNIKSQSAIQGGHRLETGVDMYSPLN